MDKSQRLGCTLLGLLLIDGAADTVHDRRRECEGERCFNHASAAPAQTSYAERFTLTRSFVGFDTPESNGSVIHASRKQCAIRR